LKRYRMIEGKQFTAYRRSLRDYYALEQRWPDAPFWRRRHGTPPVDNAHAVPDGGTQPMSLQLSQRVT
jgi:hypothetical protein